MEFSCLAICISQFSKETEPIRYIYRERERKLLKGIGSRDYGEYGVPRSAVYKLETQGSQWLSSSLSWKTSELGEPMVCVPVRKQAGRRPTKSRCFSSVQGQEKTNVPAQGSQAGRVPYYSAFLFYSGL